MTASIGTATLSDHSSPERLYDDADHAMYTAKRGRRPGRQLPAQRSAARRPISHHGPELPIPEVVISLRLAERVGRPRRSHVHTVRPPATSPHPSRTTGSTPGRPTPMRLLC